VVGRAVGIGHGPAPRFSARRAPPNATPVWPAVTPTL
jgi:hypothetical protein